jgi:hypothetical protein
MHDSTHRISLLNCHVDGMTVFPGCSLALIGFSDPQLFKGIGRQFIVGVAECASEAEPHAEHDLKPYALLYGTAVEEQYKISDSFSVCNASVAFSFVDYCINEQLRYSSYSGKPANITMSKGIHESIVRSRSLAGLPALLATKRVFPSGSGRERRAMQHIHQNSFNDDQKGAFNFVRQVMDKEDPDITHAMIFKADITIDGTEVTGIRPEYKANQNSGWAMVAFEEDAYYIMQHYTNIHDAIGGLAEMEYLFINPHMENPHQAAANEKHPQHFTRYAPDFHKAIRFKNYPFGLS